MSLLSELDPDVAYPATASVPDSGLHSLARFATYGALRAHFAGRGDCFVGQDRNIYYRYGDPRVVVAPDVFVCFGVDPEPLETAASYRVWEVGAPPAFVLEIASKKTFPDDVEVKPGKYLEMGVEEYWRLDPTGGEFLHPVLQGEHRRSGRWEPIGINRNADGTLTGHSPTLGLDLHWQPPKLRLHGPAGDSWLLDPDDRKHAHLAEVTARRAAEAELAALRAQSRGANNSD